jgi:hypothetical protein
LRARAHVLCVYVRGCVHSFILCACVFSLLLVVIRRHAATCMIAFRRPRKVKAGYESKKRICVNVCSKACVTPLRYDICSFSQWPGRTCSAGCTLCTAGRTARCTATASSFASRLNPHHYPKRNRKAAQCIRRNLLPAVRHTSRRYEEARPCFFAAAALSSALHVRISASGIAVRKFGSPISTAQR